MNKPCMTCKTIDPICCDKCEKISKYHANLRSKRKYRRSDILISSAEQLMQEKWIWFGCKPYHFSFIISMPFRTVMRLIETKSLWVAELKQKPLDQQQQT